MYQFRPKDLRIAPKVVEQMDDVQKLALTLFSKLSKMRDSRRHLVLKKGRYLTAGNSGDSGK